MKTLLKQISLYLLSHSCIRITCILLTCPDNINVNMLQVCKKSSAEIMCACKTHKSQCCEFNIVSNEIFAPFQCVPVRVNTRKYHH